MAKAKETTLYIRNRRPNRVAFLYAGNRVRLEHRGHREDSWALPSEAENEPTISRWLKQGVLEKITKDSYMRLGARTVDIAPNEFLRSHKVRARNSGVPMIASDGDTAGTLTIIADKEIHAHANPQLQWAGDLMTTEQELEEYQYDSKDSAAGSQNYPSKHRGDEEARRKQMGY